MSDVNDVIVFQGAGLNWDDPVEFMPKGDGRNRRNVLIEDKNGRSIFSNMKGTKKRALIALPTGDNTVLHACEDPERQACVYFLHNSEGNHCILRYVMGAAEDIYPIMWSEPVLNFNTESRMHNAFVIGELLYWCEGSNPPRRINMTDAIAYTNTKWGNGIGYWYIESPEPAFIVS